jgi:hypothetical protein
MSDHDTNNGKTGEAQLQPEMKQRRWDLFLGNECYGFVHAVSAQEALDRVAAFKKPFTAKLAEDQD